MSLDQGQVLATRTVGESRGHLCAVYLRAGISVSWESEDGGNYSKLQMRRFPWGLGPLNVCYFFFRRPIAAVERKKLIGAKDSLVLEITLCCDIAVKEFGKYISFLS